MCLLQLEGRLETYNKLVLDGTCSRLTRRTNEYEVGDESKQWEGRVSRSTYPTYYSDNDMGLAKRSH
ncbi:hypothetical protein J6590_033875 [Homalodisca vitripennis]|nr:hypothetical protein J6590_033875 [Homalodisca vitripennis]